MNSVIRQAAALAEGGTLMGVMTVLFLMFFVVSAAMMFRRSQTPHYAEAAMLPLADNND
jgi:cbb3-type cytochrome oxidase subunit 3